MIHDDKLLKQLNSDPNIGMRSIIEKYSGLIYAVVRKHLKSDVFCEVDVESCVSDTFAEFYCDLDKYDASLGSIRSWLCVMARNNALDRLRKYYKEKETIPIDEAWQIAESENDPAEKTVRREVIDAIKQLGKKDRELIIRKYYFSQSSKEIANAMSMTVSNVDTRTHRAIKKLKALIGGETDGK